ncbi:MAG: hypothetical protein RBT36_10845 [Desulfobulbus sp.]|nr:hypothetical protein [Desulfobulbus sp.]
MFKTIFKLNSVCFAIACMVISLACSDVHAADCGIASVEKVGPYLMGGKTNVVVTLMNKTKSNVGDWRPNTIRQFYLHQSILNQGLATFLTAYSMNRTVWVRVVDPNAKANSLMTVVYINK